MDKRVPNLIKQVNDIEIRLEKLELLAANKKNPMKKLLNKIAYFFMFIYWLISQMFKSKK